MKRSSCTVSNYSKNWFVEQWGLPPHLVLPRPWRNHIPHGGVGDRDVGRVSDITSGRGTGATKNNQRLCAPATPTDLAKITLGRSNLIAKLRLKRLLDFLPQNKRQRSLGAIAVFYLKVKKDSQNYQETPVARLNQNCQRHSHSLRQV